MAVVALGELARSPRMLNHARMLAAHDLHVELIGYCEKPLQLDPRIAVRALHPLARAAEGSAPLRFLAKSATRMGLLSLELTAALLRARPDAILVQNPPSFPTLLASWEAARASRAKLIVDWHNYGHSLLALRLPPAHPMVTIARAYEERIGRWADAAFCVSAAMQRDLRTCGIEARVLYDKPLQPLALDHAHETASPTTAVPAPAVPAPAVASAHSDHTAVPAPPMASTHSDHIVCPTGWTADEDLPLLIEALRVLDERRSTAPTSKPLLVYITGDGPLRASAEHAWGERPFKHLQIRTGYLPTDEYRRVLATAALGISLHRSTSGLDLAMKVVDLFEARIPVCALDVGKSLREQVRDGATGLLFTTATELADAIERLLGNPTLRTHMREHIARTWQQSWAQHWNEVAGDMFGIRA